MDFNSFQTLSAVAVLVGVLITGLGGFGQYYFSKKIEQQKDSLSQKNEFVLNNKIDELLKGNELLKERIKPFEEIAEAKYPTENINIALEKLKNDMSKIEKEYQKTFFEISSKTVQPQQDGSVKYNFTLNPIGNNVIPILTILCKTKNGTPIKVFNVSGKTLPIMSSDSRSKDNSAYKRAFREMYPEKVSVEIITEKPDGLDIEIAPLKENK
jgi:hypothetical protein